MKKGYWILLGAAIIGGGAYVQFSDKFEKTPPKIELEGAVNNQIYWNTRSLLKVNFSDESPLKNLEISYKKSGEQNYTQLDLEQPKANSGSYEIKLPAPKFNEKITSYELVIKATDSSLWQWFTGNESVQKYELIVDKTPPVVSTLANSYSITRGGAAAVVFYAADDNLRELYIQSGSHKFQATPYVKDGYYVSLLAWDVQDSSYSADIIATDAAGNTTREHVPLYQKERRYKTSEITATEAFVQGKIRDLFERYADGQSAEPAAMLDYVNAKLRTENEKLIHEISSHQSGELVGDFALRPFIPLKNAAKVADFADHRYYLYNGARASESWHMGIDLASVKMAPIVLSNPGKLVFAQENGIYGLNLLVDHGLGLFTLYGHCSSVKAKVGDELSAGTTIAQTGTSGLALGDHLHFGVLIQGVEVRPEEWFDAKWMNDYIFSVLKTGKARIK